MDNTRLAELIRSFESEAEVKEGKQFIEVTVPASKLHQLAKKMRVNEETDLDYLFCLTGVDYGNDLGVVYHLRSTKHNHEAVLKTRTSDRTSPVIDSVTDIWKTAEFHEREVYDLLGITFSGHPDLRRLLLDNSWGFPLRKDYIDEVNIVTK
jgi:NADH:ubiquinone oxidoreductase subunit C